MTTYTISEKQRQQLIEAYQSGEDGLLLITLLRNLQPNTQEPVGEIMHLDELNETWTKHLPIGTKLYTSPAQHPTEPLEFPEPMKVSTAPSYDFANGWNACLATISAKRGVK